MKIIPLTQGKETIVDDDKYDELMKYKWYFHKTRDTVTGYAETAIHNSNVKNIYNLRLHRFLLNLQKGDKTQIDHINGNKLDNRMENLRICTNTENSRNKGIQKNNKTGVKGVTIKKANTNKLYQACICLNNKNKYLGYYKTIKEAAIAYNNAAIEHFGEFAYLNDISKL